VLTRKKDCFAAALGRNHCVTMRREEISVELRVELVGIDNQDRLTECFWAIHDLSAAAGAA